MGEPVALGAGEVLSGRPFTDAAHTVREAEVMRAMLERERRRARAWRENGDESVATVIEEHDPEGRRHLLVVTDKERLLGSRGLTAVGFFGRPREDVEHSVLFELERMLVERMAGYAEAGLLSYYDVELVKGAYGNLILFSTAEVPPEWHGDPIHRRAVSISPSHYHEVRLHKGSIPGRLLDGGGLVVERTKYFDFTGGDLWQAVRSFSPPEG